MRSKPLAIEVVSSSGSPTDIVRKVHQQEQLQQQQHLYPTSVLVH